MIVDDFMGNLIEVMWNVVLGRGSDHNLLAKFMEAFEHQHEALGKEVFRIANCKLRDANPTELTSRNQSSYDACKQLL